MVQGEFVFEERVPTFGRRVLNPVAARANLRWTDLIHDYAEPLRARMGLVAR